MRAMPTLHLIDGSGYVFRAYHALPPLSTSKGMPTGAVRGVASMLLRDLREQKPTHLAVCFDLQARERRAEIYPEYKANRVAPPDDLVPQFALVRDVVRALELPLLEVAGYEADDIIATLAREAVEKGFDVVVVTGDKDLMQLVRDGKVRMYDGMKDAWFGDAEVQARWGVPPSKVGDLLALTGDASDNVPGVKGVGEKTAAQLLGEFGSLDGVLSRAQDIKKPKLREAVAASIDQIRLARRLVTLDDRVPLDLTVEQLALRPPDATKARALFADLELFSLVKELPQPPPVAARVEATVVRDSAGLASMVDALKTQPRVGLNVLLANDRPLTDPVVGYAFASADRAWYVPISRGELADGAPLPDSAVVEAIRPLLESMEPLKDGHALKRAATALLRRGVALRGIGVDCELASLLLNAARREHFLEDLCRERLNRELPAPPLDARKRPALDGSAHALLAGYAGSRADAALRLAAPFEEELRTEGVWRVYDELERPVVPILAAAEAVGIRVDAASLRAQGAEFEKELAAQVAELHRLAGTEFNPNAPAQLAEVLFEKLKLPVIRRGKTGPSTDAEVLEKLAEQHPLPAKILEYRSIAKLKNTYLDTLPELVAADGRIHTTFHQLGAATGRLSSNDPNLQNIPIRTDLGKRIRGAFVADDGCLLVSADYSQIELRVLAHFSGDPALRDSFAKGEDVHTRTAAEIHGVTLLEVKPAMRRVAKMINYAIAYGLSPYGLSTRLEIPTDEAKRIIDAYFERYAGVKKWLDATLRAGREQGRVYTLLGRRRQLADLASKNPAARQAAERAAVNAPIQGTAADIVKLAMVAVDRALRGSMPEARMLLQVHDELLFEVPSERVDDLVSLVRPLMEGAVKLDVPLVVDVGSGRSWAEAH